MKVSVRQLDNGGPANISIDLVPTDDDEAGSLAIVGEAIRDIKIAEWVKTAIYQGMTPAEAKVAADEAWNRVLSIREPAPDGGLHITAGIHALRW